MDSSEKVSRCLYTYMHGLFCNTFFGSSVARAWLRQTAARRKIFKFSKSKISVLIREKSGGHYGHEGRQKITDALKTSDSPFEFGSHWLIILLWTFCTVQSLPNARTTTEQLIDTTQNPIAVWAEKKYSELWLMSHIESLKHSKELGRGRTLYNIESTVFFHALIRVSYGQVVDNGEMISFVHTYVHNKNDMKKGPKFRNNATKFANFLIYNMNCLLIFTHVQ